MLQLSLTLKNEEELSESAGLLISILMRYPEICAISFNPDDDTIILSFSFRKIIPAEQFLKCKEGLGECLAAYGFLENKKPPIVEVHWITIDALSILKIKYDVKNMTKNEIALIISFLQEEFNDLLMREQDTNDPLDEEDLILQEEFIGHMLENFKVAVPRKKLMAFREEGKVHVFKK